MLGVSAPIRGTLVVSIESDEGESRYPLADDRAVVVAGPIGENVIHIHDGAVHMHDSPCRDKLCIAMGGIDRPGQWIACLPNRVFVQILGRADGDFEVDAGTF